MARPDYTALAREAAGNHRSFESFAWHARPDDSDLWTIVYTSNRDSGLLEQSNAAAIGKIMAPYVRREWAREESHSHWAVGHVDGYAIRVYRPDGKVTRAFKAWCNIAAALESYPVLDEEDYSAREEEEAAEAWDGMSMRDRIAECKRAGVSILQARHGWADERQDYQIRDWVRDRWVNH